MDTAISITVGVIAGTGAIAAIIWFSFVLERRRETRRRAARSFHNEGDQGEASISISSGEYGSWHNGGHGSGHDGGGGGHH